MSYTEDHLTRSDVFGPELAGGKGKVCLGTPIQAPKQKSPRPPTMACAICSALGELELACADCREKAAQFDAYRNEAAETHEDELRMNLLDRERLLLAALLLAAPAGKSAREVIDSHLEAGAFLGM